MQSPSVVPVVLAGFAAFLGLYATQPLLPLLTETFDATPFAVSLTVTAPTVAVAIAAPAIGRLADVVGRQRVMIGAAYALAAATILSATSQNLSQLVWWRFVQGLATPGIFAIAIAYIHDVWPPSKVGRATASYVSGTVVGGFSGRLVAGLAAANVSWRAAFVLLAVGNLAAATVLWLMLPRGTAHVPPDRREGHGTSLLRLLRNRQLLATNAIGACVLFTQVAMFTYVTFHLSEEPFRLGPAALGSLFVVYLVGAVVTPLVGRWIDRVGPRVALTAATAVGAGGALLTLVPSIPAIVAGLSFTATGVFVAQAAASSHIGTATQSDRGLAVGLYALFYYAGGSLGGALPALAWTRSGWTACVALVVAVQVAMVTIAFACWRQRDHLPADAEPLVSGRD